MTKELEKILANKDVNILRVKISDFLKDKITDSERMQINDMVKDIVNILVITKEPAACDKIANAMAESCNKSENALNSFQQNIGEGVLNRIKREEIKEFPNTADIDLLNNDKLK